MQRWDKRIAAMIDHTVLDPTRPWRDVDAACAAARKYGFAAVVVHPYHVAAARKSLEGSPVKTCSVVSFPFGAGTLAAKERETAALLDDGAEEVDMVMNVAAFIAGDTSRIRAETERCVRICGGAAAFKLIIETACLDARQIRDASVLAADAGVDYVKTSTGYGPGGATVEAVRLIRSVTEGKVGVKASGGIRTRAFALELLEAGATRLGCSASLAVIGVASD